MREREREREKDTGIERKREVWSKMNYGERERGGDERL